MFFTFALVVMVRCGKKGCVSFGSRHVCSQKMGVCVNAPVYVMGQLHLNPNI